jgi:P-type Cu+ transporter
MQVKDPVCGMMVDDATATKSTYQGKAYYFCSDQCKKTFDANPAKFAKPAEAGAGR